VHCLLIATRNSHKTREFAQILGDRYAVCDLTGSPEITEVEETGKTLEENAVVKARSASEYLPSLVVADDSGLEVDALHGAPGILSARYAGPQASDKENTEKLLNGIARAEGHSTRYPARFRCVLALAEKGHLLQTFEGVAEGTITRSPRGAAGFGYDPIFVPNGFEQTFAEMPAEVKNRISHRARAIAQLAEYLADRELR
jgi:XTP/dITP diphosphohydrolase